MIKYDIKNTLLSDKAYKSFKIFINTVEKVAYASNNPYILREQVWENKALTLKKIIDFIYKWEESDLSSNTLDLLYDCSTCSYLRLLLINYLIDLDSIEYINYLRDIEKNKKDKICSRLNSTLYPFFHLVNLNRLRYFALLSWYDPKKSQDLILYFNSMK